MDLAIQNIERLVEKLGAYHTICSPLFQRREQREAAYSYLQRLLAALPRKSIEPLVSAVEGVAPHAVRAMPSFTSTALLLTRALKAKVWDALMVDSHA
jgi:hypothetical protein